MEIALCMRSYYNNGTPVNRAVVEELPACNEHEKMLDVMESEVETAIKSLRKGEDNIAVQAGGG